MEEETEELLLDSVAELGAEEAKRRHAARTKNPGVARNSELIAAARKAGRHDLVAKLRKRPVRSRSGVAVIAVMTRPGSCPFNCAYCPTSGIAAKSYTGHEPAALRARQNDYDSFKQVQARISHLEQNGHETSKCDVIVMGGTFNSLPPEYQTNFVKGVFDGLNGFVSSSLDAAIKENETASHRAVGITFETRPDFASKRQVDDLMEFGATRIELGVQSLDDEVLKKVNRGHGVQAVADATKTCKDAFLKVCYHVMPGLFSTPEKDAQMFKRLFTDPDFKPDALKIYPALVIEGTKLWEWWKAGEFTPYDDDTAARAIAMCKTFVPPYCRIMRVDRDIPSKMIVAGVKKTNLRQFVKKECEARGISCRCIRCREVGLNEFDAGNVKLTRLEYSASGGEEVFLSLESGGALVGFLRLRRHSTDDKLAGVRELRVYGAHTPVGAKARAAQHHGFGSQLLAQAELISAGEWGCKKLVVTSGVGAREYYFRHGYGRDGVYVAKRF